MSTDWFQFSTVSVALPVRVSEAMDNVELPPPKSMTELPVTVRELMLWVVPFRERVPPAPSVRFVHAVSWLLPAKLRFPEPDTLTVLPRAFPEDLPRSRVPPVTLDVPLMLFAAVPAMTVVPDPDIEKFPLVPITEVMI